ncbi:MAG: LPS-assembly protein LptD [Nitrospiraceae bacterium]|nr:MAG: LPS-assembly protein LptD [Nitrospiraceae bacterium]
MKKIHFAILFLAITLIFFTITAFAEEQANITAQQLQYFSQTNTYEAKGNVRIEFEDAILSADEMNLDGNTSDAVVTGNVLYEDADARIRADKLEINLKTKLGTVYNSYIFYKKENFHLRGENVKKIGDKSFYLNTATLTSCDSSKPPWHIAAEDISATQHESISARHARLYVKNTPVLYTPYFWAPISKERQTGFLFPSFGYSSSRGYYYKQGFFLAIKENQDATIYLDYYSEKDLAQGLDYRYILTPDINGEFWLYHARDNEPSRDLYEVKTYHNLKLPHEISAYLKIHAVNEFDYYETLDSTSFRRFGLSTWEMDPFEFASEERLQKYLESNMQISKPLTYGRTYLLAQTRQSLEGKSNEIPQALPEVGFIINTLSKGPFSLNAAVKGVNFWRRDGQKGTRFDIYPNFFLSYGRLINLTQRIGLRETAYFLDSPSVHKSRALFDLSTTLTTKFAKKYSSLIHILEPSVEYEYIPSVDNDNIPFFDTVDTIQHTSNINYAITNRLSGLSPLNLESRFRLSQSYSLLNVEKHFSPVLAESVLSSENVDFSLNASYDVHDRQIAETIASVTLKNARGYVGVGENYRRASSLDQVTFEAGLNNPINIRGKNIPVDLHGKLWYDMKGNGVQEFNIRSTYTHQCWAMSVSYTKRPDEYQIVFAIELKGLGALHIGSL